MVYRTTATLPRSGVLLAQLLPIQVLYVRDCHLLNCLLRLLTECKSLPSYLLSIRLGEDRVRTNAVKLSASVYRPTTLGGTFGRAFVRYSLGRRSTADRISENTETLPTYRRYAFKSYSCTRWTGIRLVTPVCYCFQKLLSSQSWRLCMYTAVSRILSHGDISNSVPNRS